MPTESIFYQFCKHVDETIFSDENRGSVVAFVVDQTFIDNFCRTYDTDEDKLMQDARSHLRKVLRNPLFIRGMIAIQVFAATKRANSDGITEANYRDRLNDLIFSDIGELQNWMNDYQDAMWRGFYEWCDANGFLVSRKCKPFSGKGRFVQYPLQEALRVFTAEALLNFARAFVDNKLTPSEDYSFNTFWEIVSWRSLASYLDSSNARRIYNDPKLHDDAKQQIYNFFLRWDGDYREANYSPRKKTISALGNCLYLADGFESFDIRDAAQKLITSYAVSSAQYRVLTNSKNRIPARRAGIFVFKRDPVYDMWEEVRFLEEGEEGLAVVFQDASSLAYAFRNCKVLLMTPRLKIYQLTPKSGPAMCFTERRKCYLEGGLRVGRERYLLGAAQYLVREEPVTVRIDHEPLSDESGRYSLNSLGAGLHVISVPGQRSIRFELLSPTVVSSEWSVSFMTWEMKRATAEWRFSKKNDGISGMNLSSICLGTKLGADEVPTMQAWCRLHLGESPESENAVIKTLKGIRDHGKL